MVEAGCQIAVLNRSQGSKNTDYAVNMQFMEQNP